MICNVVCLSEDLFVIVVCGTGEDITRRCSDLRYGEVGLDTSRVVPSQIHQPQSSFFESPKVGINGIFVLLQVPITCQQLPIK